jgi:hypothetical protein
LGTSKVVADAADDKGKRPVCGIGKTKRHLYSFANKALVNLLNLTYFKGLGHQLKGSKTEKYQPQDFSHKGLTDGFYKI